ncbi:MAG TPA: tetratricopeptide repeat protein [Kofleriaceae bacterium]|nr:tetratricopeptide repeat protein [Kofleriaceae bacterium]
MSSRVGKPMSRLGLVAASLLLAAACGGKGKDARTTPDKKAAGGDTSQSMNDSGDPAVPGGAGGGSPGGATAGGPGTPGATPGGTPGGPTNGDGSGIPPEPTVIPPNLDVDPAKAKAQVDQSLAMARTALSGLAPDPEGALKHARAALAIDAASVDAAAMVAFAYYHKKLYDTAELVLDDLFKREAAKKNAHVYYVYGLIYDQTNRPDAAVKAYRTAFELNPSHASALVNLGVHQLRNSQYQEAQQTFERLVQQFQRADAVTLTSLGSAYRGRSAEFPPGAPDRDLYVRRAEAEYKRAEKANPGYGPVYYNLGLLYLDTDPYPGIADPVQRLQTAKAYFDRYKNMAGVDMKLFDSRMKDVDKALKRAEKAKKKKKAAP